MNQIQQILKQVGALGEKSRTVVAISGFAGSGKSTLARQLATLMPNSARIRGDDFLDPTRSHRRSPDWDGVDRHRLRALVIEPFHKSGAGMFQRYDWSKRTLGLPEPIPPVNILIVDAIGLFHPEIIDALDFKIWVDTPLQIAAQRGKARDQALGRNHEELWDEVWIPNELEFAENYAPREVADMVFNGV